MAETPLGFKRARWSVDGPQLVSYHESQAMLGIDYTDGCDSRWPNFLMLGPQLNTVSCAAAGGTATNVNGLALSGTMNATKFLYAIRGTKWAKIRASDMTLISNGTETALAETATSIHYVQNKAGTQEIGIGMDATTMRVITAVGAGATDTHVAAAHGLSIAILDHGHPANLIALLGKTSGGVRNQCYELDLNGPLGAGTNTLAATTVSATGIVSVASLSGDPITAFTGFATDGTKWILGTSNGPYYLDRDFQQFRSLIPEIDDSPLNCAGMGTYSYIGVIYPTSDGIRYQLNVYTGESIGPEIFENNNSPVNGYGTAIGGTNRWVYAAYKNPSTTDTYILAGKPGGTSHPVGWYVIAKLAATDCQAIMNVGNAQGARTNSPIMVIGSGSNVAYWIEGRTGLAQYRDSIYRFASSGTAYGTEWIGRPDIDKHVEFVEVETVDCSATQTITVSISVDGGVTYTQVGAPITSDSPQGRPHRLPVVGDSEIRGKSLKWKADFATASNSASPKIKGQIVIGYTEFGVKDSDDAVFEVTR